MEIQSIVYYCTPYFMDFSQTFHFVFLFLDKLIVHPKYIIYKWICCVKLSISYHRYLCYRIFFSIHQLISTDYFFNLSMNWDAYPISYYPPNPDSATIKIIKIIQHKFVSSMVSKIKKLRLKINNDSCFKLNMCLQ